MSDKVKEAFLIYTDDDGQKTQAYVTIIEMNSGFIKFRTNANNTITIPISRLIKCKEKGE